MDAPRRVRRSFTATLSVLLALAVQGCMHATVREYEPLTRDLDGKSELHISTYPAGFPRVESSIPFLYKALQTPDSVYFKVFIREAGREAGPNPHVESIEIHSFSYQLPGQDPVPLIAGFEGSFWMQDNPEDNPEGVGAVPFGEQWYLQLSIDLTLNGQRFQVDGRVQATEREYTRPLVLHALQ